MGKLIEVKFPTFRKEGSRALGRCQSPFKTGKLLGNVEKNSILHMFTVFSPGVNKILSTDILFYNL
jgi:hypothetical protein